MQSHQLHNPLQVVHSLDQEISPSDNASDPNVKPFSLRQYVHATRERDISLNWPFPERYLKTCLKHGIINVLPPLESHDSTNDQSLRKDVGLSCSQEEKATDVLVQNNVTKINKGLSCSQVEKGNVVSTQNNVMNICEDKINKASCNLYFDESVAGVSREGCQSLSNSRFKCGEENQLSPDTVLEPVVVGIQSSTTAPSFHSHDGHSTEALTSSKRFRHKRRKRKGKLKKRSMADICAVAKHRTLEDLEKSYRLGCDSVTPQEIFSEENAPMTDVDHGCKPELTEDCLEKNYQSNHDAAADEILSGKRKREVKFKFSRCKSKSWDKKIEVVSSSSHKGSYDLGNSKPYENYQKIWVRECNSGISSKHECLRGTMEVQKHALFQVNHNKHDYSEDQEAQQPNLQRTSSMSNLIFKDAAQAGRI